MFKNYGLTLAQCEALLASQGGGCAICGAPIMVMLARSRSGKLHVDHRHSDGKVRGLLCGQCNMMLGNARDLPETLRAGADYLEKAP